MAKIKKKGTSGNAKNFITRTQAVRKLQISLADFRRLCIFKGIYPREPRNKKKANKGSTAPATFYYTKDIQYLLHEPVLQKFREHKTFAKRLSKALGRGDYGDAKRLEDQKPRITLDHLVKERYPSFIDALRDLDDALSMLFLFANLPTNHNLPVATIAACQRLCSEWQHYVIRAQVLRKSFLSIKGIYYQTEIHGQEILWLVPYKFAQNIPADVDFRIMHTFVQFYTTLLGFVMFRLYTNEGLVYPPKFDEEADARGAGLRAFKLVNRTIGEITEDTRDKKQQQTLQKRLATLDTAIANIDEDDAGEQNGVTDAEAEPKDTIDTFEPIKTHSAVDILPQPQESGPEAGGAADPTGLFANWTVYLNRETPREPLEFILRSFGCKRIGWDPVLGDGSFTESEADPSITHQVVDRPPSSQPTLPQAQGSEATAAGGVRYLGRIYIQPQYVWDCINAGRILLPTEYAPGALLPPHLSPWVRVSTREYDPTAPPLEVEDDSEGEIIEKGMGSGLDEEEFTGFDVLKKDKEKDENEEGLEDDSEAEEEAARQQHQKELEAELAGAKPPVITEAKKKSKKTKQQREEEEKKEMQKIMMTRKKRKLYEKMVYSNKKKDEEAEALRSKRRKIERLKKAKVAV